jgi:hypothetical protein
MIRIVRRPKTKSKGAGGCVIQEDERRVEKIVFPRRKAGETIRTKPIMVTNAVLSTIFDR